MGALGDLLLKIFGTSTKARHGIFETAHATRIIAIGGIMAVIAAAYSAVQVLIDGIVWAIPTPMLTASSWIIPSNADECVAAVISSYFIKAAMDYKTKIIELQANSPPSNFY